MKNKFFNTPKLKFLYLLFALLITFMTAFRLIFLAYFNSEVNAGTGEQVIQALLLGLRFDIRLCVFLLFPAMLLINLPIKTDLKIKFINSFYAILFAAITFLFITDAGYFAYLKTRLNSTVLSYLKNPLISFEMVSQTYPWPLFIIIIAGFALTFFWLMKKVVSKALLTWYTGSKKERVLGHIVFFFFLSLGTYGSVKRYPLRWSEAYASTDPFSSNLALNPILYMADTYSFNHKDFDETKVKQTYEIVADFLGVDKNSAHYDPSKLSFLREYPGNPDRQKEKPNIVVIIMESMGYYKTGLGGSMVNPTPYLDKLASESLLFTRFYTPTIATARSVFAAITSLPDTSKIKTGSRNPYIVNQHTNIGELNGYEKFYFLGGSANWGNIRGVLSYNIPGLRIFEEGSYASPKVDVWGISDLNLFKEATVAINKLNLEKPFFSLIQSSGFHRPYTIPKDSDDFKTLTLNDVKIEDIKAYGFDSMEEYNAMRLQDYALGRFFEMAKKQKWYDNTIFLVFGDHSLPHNNAKNVKEWEKHQYNSYHVPLIIHSPKYIKPGIEKKIASEMDVMPTVAGLTGVPYKTRSLGKDLFNTELDSKRAAFSYNWNAPYHLSLVDDEFYFEYIPGNQQGVLVHHKTESAENVKDKFPEKYKEMETLAKGLYETARYLLMHNSRLY